MILSVGAAGTSAECSRVDRLCRERQAQQQEYRHKSVQKKKGNRFVELPSGTSKAKE
jgi:hypothetical protein